MAKICILSALLLQLLYTLVQGQNSPCPDRFTYIKRPGSDETIGEIEIQNPSINNLELRLKVDLKIDTQLPTSFVGGVDLTKSKEDAARDVLEGKPLLYHVYFPVQNPLPTVHRIRFNNDQICSGPEVSGSVVTIITLEHNFKIIIRSAPDHNQPNPPPQNRPAEQKPNNGGNPFVSAFTSGTPEQAPFDPNDVRIENHNDCGSSNSGSFNPLIAHGKKTLPGQWPWVAAIFRVTYEYDFICSGTILTTKHVLTAGHCLKTSSYTNETVPANILLVVLGRYKLMDFNETESITMDVARHIVHPEYTHTTTADSDLAILILRSSVEFTAFIRPICLLSPSVDSRRLEQTYGIIVGWGEDEHGNPFTEEPKLKDICIRKNPVIAIISSERTFCAGWLNYSGPCNGDGGSGLVIFDSVTGRYQLRGIVSRTLSSNQMFCDHSEYAVFVDVFKYLPWINNTLKIIIQPAQNQPNPSPQNRPAKQKSNSGSNPFLSPFTPRSSQQTPRLAPPTLVDEIENYTECGISSRDSESPIGLGQRKPQPGEWPWVAAIFRVIQAYEYLCGGTLLTTRHVLTAGYCLKISPNTNETIPANILSVVLGRYILKDFNESESVTMDVASHICHPDYKHTETADSDLAIIILRSPVEFTAFIRPICLLPLSVDSRRFKQRYGFNVGWGKYKDSNRYTMEPMLIMSIVYTDLDYTCHQRDLRFTTLTSERTICAEFIYNSGPYYVNIGSGLVIYDSATGRYRLRGIVSRIMIDQQTLYQTHYAVFTDVFKYLNWINQQIYST